MWMEDLDAFFEGLRNSKSRFILGDGDRRRIVDPAIALPWFQRMHSPGVEEFSIRGE